MTDTLYLRAYLDSIRLCRAGDGAVLLIGYPMAYAIVRAPGGVAAAAAVSGDPAVLDQLSDPRLCLDRAPEGERLIKRLLLAGWA